MARPVIRMSAYAGIAGVALLATMIVVIGALTPEYSHWSRLINELAARDAPYGRVMGYAGLTGFGISLVLFAPAVLQAHRPSPAAILATALVVAAAMGIGLAGLFPCDAGCRLENPSVTMTLHTWSSFVGFLAATAAPIVLGLDLVRTRARSPYLLFSLFTGGAMFGVTAWILAVGPEAGYIGALQRLVLLLFSAWILATAVKALRTNAAPD